MLCCLLQVHILLRQGAQPMDCLKAAFSAHVFLHMLDNEQGQAASGSSGGTGSSSSSTSIIGSSSSSSSGGSSLAAAAPAEDGRSNSSSQKASRWGWRRGKEEAEAAAAAAAAAAAPLTGAALVRETWKKLAIALPWSSEPGSEYYWKLLERSKSAVDSLYSDFSRQADKQGWKLGQTMLNPKEARLVKLQLAV